MIDLSLSNHLSQESQEFADHSTCLKNTDSHNPSPPRDFLDAKSEETTTCGKTIRHADSLEENSFTRPTESVKLVNHTNG